MFSVDVPIKSSTLPRSIEAYFRFSHDEIGQASIQLLFKLGGLTPDLGLNSVE